MLGRARVNQAARLIAKRLGTFARLSTTTHTICPHNLVKRLTEISKNCDLVHVPDYHQLAIELHNINNSKTSAQEKAKLAVELLNDSRYHRGPAKKDIQDHALYLDYLLFKRIQTEWLKGLASIAKRASFVPTGANERATLLKKRIISCNNLSELGILVDSLDVTAKATLFKDARIEDNFVGMKADAIFKTLKQHYEEIDMRNTPAFRPNLIF